MEHGRPPIYNSPEELSKKIQEYFDTGVRKKTIVIGSGKDKCEIEVPIPTITGLCLFLGFDSRQSFYDYEKRAGFSYTIKRARTLIEREYEEMLSTGNSTGAIFALKNFQWSDKTEIEHTGELKSGLTVHVIQATESIPESEEDVAGQ